MNDSVHMLDASAPMEMCNDRKSRPKTTLCGIEYWDERRRYSTHGMHAYLRWTKKRDLIGCPYCMKVINEHPERLYSEDAYVW